MAIGIIATLMFILSMLPTTNAHAVASSTVFSGDSWIEYLPRGPSPLTIANPSWRSRISALPAASMDAASMSASRVVLELPRPSRLPSSFPDRTSTPYVCVPPRRRQDLTVHEVCWCTEVTRIIPTLERGGIVRIKTKVGFVWRFHPYSLSEIGSTGQVRAVVNRIERERAPTYA